MTHWVGSISYEQRDNWEICKDESVFGSNTTRALSVRAGDELFIWGSRQGWLARCRATADARRPSGIADVPWPDPEQYVALIPIEVLDEPAEPLAMPGARIKDDVGIDTVQLPQFPRIDVQHAERLTVLLGEEYRSHVRTERAPAPVVDEPVLRELDELRVDRQLGRPAPYQQVLLLWAISEAVRGEDRLRPFSAVGDRLRSLLRPFAVGETPPDPELPWFALRKSSWWHLSPAPDRPVSRGGRDFVRQEDPVGGLSSDLYRRVRADVPFRERAIEKLSGALRGHSALAATLETLLTAAPPAPDLHAEAAEVLRGLIGRPITTASGQVNEVLRLEPPLAIVATTRSPEGQPVPIADVQRGLDLLRRDGTVPINVPTLGHRSSFVGAVLASRPNVALSGPPPVASLQAAARTAEPIDSELRASARDQGKESFASGTYELGRVYDREDLHAAARQAGLSPGNRYSGITVVGKDLCIFWNPFKRLYANRWIAEPREFTYSGEGSIGDHVETGGNLRLIEREASGEPVLLFYKVKPDGSAWAHLGAYLVAAHEWGSSHGEDGRLRRDLRFRFEQVTSPAWVRPVDVPVFPPRAPEPSSEQELWDALNRGAASADRQRGTKTHANKRLSDPLKTEYVVQRAIDFGGACELCDRQPGWVGDDGRPHFQAHHIDADIDLVDWIAALCGTCHDRMHHSTDRLPVADELLVKIQARQASRGRPVTSRPFASPLAR